MLYRLRFSDEGNISPIVLKAGQSYKTEFARLMTCGKSLRVGSPDCVGVFIGICDRILLKVAFRTFHTPEPGMAQTRIHAAAHAAGDPISVPHGPFSSGWFVGFGLFVVATHGESAGGNPDYTKGVGCFGA